MTDFESRVAAAREKMIVSNVDLSHIYAEGFDAAAALYRDEMAKRDVWIARLQKDAEDDRAYYKTEIARLEAALEEEKWETAAVNHDVEFSVAKGKEMARLAHAEEVLGIRYGHDAIAARICKLIDGFEQPVEPAQRKAHRVEMRPEDIKPPTPEAIKAAEEAYGFKALIEPALTETDDKP